MSLMRRVSLNAAPVLFFCLSASCGKPTAQIITAGKLGPDGVDVSAVQLAFKTADPSARFSLDDDLKMIGAGAYGDAAQGLQKLAANPKTTPEQKKALEDLQQVLNQLPAVTSNR